MTYTDTRDGQTYDIVELNGQRWLAENLRYDAGEGCFMYDGNAERLPAWGRLYTWEAAQRACPPGWRLPTPDEWKALLDWAGGYFDWGLREEKGDSVKALEAFAHDGKAADFGLNLSGWCNPMNEFFDGDQVAWFWTSQSDQEEGATSVDFNHETGISINPNDGKSNAYSLRLIADV